MRSNDILTGLNPKQQEAVSHWGSPLLILAGAGSGKTRALTHRAAWLVLEKGFLPNSLLLLTFTNKAAAEIKERIVKLLASHPASQTSQPFAGTFHSFCARVLRQSGKSIGINPSFVIFDDGDQQDVLKSIIAKLGLTKSLKPQVAKALISEAKNELINPLEYAEYARGDVQRNVSHIYLEYQKALKRNDALDFDDLLGETVRLLKNEEQVLVKYRNHFQYVLVDEWQDTNKAQYEITKFLTHRDRNLTVVGDAAQCLLPGTQISTLNGLKYIENIQVNDVVTAAAGRGKTYSAPVQKVKISNYNGKIFIIKTKSGKILRATPNHILFARLNKAANVYYVYLMFRRDKGYRVGLAKSTRVTQKGRSEIGLLVRANQENADKMWILKVCSTRPEAIFWEQWFIAQYGIPSMVFSTGGRSMLVTQEQVDNLYSSIDTTERAKRLFSELDMFEEYPHHRPKGIASKISPDRQIVHFTLFSDKRPSLKSPWCGHRVTLNTSNVELKERLKKFKQYIRPGKRSTWRIENCYWSYEKSLALAEDIANEGQIPTINHSAFITDNKKFIFTPVSHLRETMEVGIIKNGQVVTDEIVSVNTEEYAGKVYDLDVETLHNYIANGIVVHNSIYAWRGADYRNIMYLQKDFPDLKTTNLDQNYRSTQNILDAAYGVISRNKSHPILKLWTDNLQGEKIVLYPAISEIDEANYVVSQIQQLTDHRLQSTVDLSDIAVLYRTNAQSRVLEEALLHEGTPYVLFGGTRFYERREVKDVLAYLRLLINPKNEVAHNRAEKLGKTRLKKLEQFMQDEVKRDEGKVYLKDSEATTRELLDKVLENTAYLELYDTQNEEDLARVENIKELRSVATEFPNPYEFLEQVTLVETIQNSRRNPQLTTHNLSQSNAVTLMTAHSAKGLEFKIVFIVGLEEGLFPHSRALLDNEELEEERRLAYVGITRAKERLFLTYARRRLIFGQSGSSLPSRFLSEIPEKLLENNFQKPQGTSYLKNELKNYLDDYDF